MIISELLVEDLIDWLEIDLDSLYDEDDIEQCNKLIEELKTLEKRNN